MIYHHIHTLQNSDLKTKTVTAMSKTKSQAISCDAETTIGNDIVLATLAKMQWTTDMELCHWVTGSMGHLGHLSRPGHRVIILTR